MHQRTVDWLLKLGWRSSHHLHLPPLWPGFDPELIRGLWLVDLNLTPRGFLLVLWFSSLRKNQLSRWNLCHRAHWSGLGDWVTNPNAATLNEPVGFKMTRDNMFFLNAFLYFCDLQTRIRDWRNGALDSPYLVQKLEEADQQLKQYEESAVPPGWTCHWNRYSMTSLLCQGVILWTLCGGELILESRMWQPQNCGNKYFWHEIHQQRMLQRVAIFASQEMWWINGHVGPSREHSSHYWRQHLVPWS